MFCIIFNNMQCKDGDLILLDVGAEYANYSSDLIQNHSCKWKIYRKTKANL